MKKIFFLVTIWYTFPFFATAQTRPLSLNDAIATSLQNNFDIQLTRNDSLVRALDLAYSTYALYPRISANTGIGFVKSKRNEIRGNGQKAAGNVQTNNLVSSLNLDWTLFDGFRMFIARDRLGSLVQLSQLQMKAQVITTVADVARIYYDIIRQQQQARALEEQMSLSEERLKIAQYKFDIGTGAKPDVLQAQIDLNGQRAALLTQQTNINTLEEQLAQLMAVPPDTDFEVADTTITFNPSLTLDSIRLGIADTNPELLVAKKNLEVAGIDLRLRKAERFPTIALNSAYNFNRNKNNAIVNPNQQNLLTQTAGLTYGFTANIPIFNAYNTRRLIKAAELNIQSQQLLYNRSAALINTGISTAYRQYDLHKQSLALEEENMKLVRENLYIARERYRLGISTFIEMRQAQQSLADAAFRLIQARYNAKIAEIELLRLRGDLVR